MRAYKKYLYHSLTSLLGCLCILIAAGLAFAAELRFEKGQLVIVQNGQKTTVPETAANLLPITNSNLRLQIVRTEDESVFPGVKPGLYFIAPEGSVRYFTGHVAEFGPEAFGDASSEASFSPDGAIVAVDWSMSMIGEWWFFTWPDLNPLPHPSVDYFWGLNHAPLIWSGNRTVLLNQMNLETKRTCNYDPCGEVSIISYNLETGKRTPLVQGTPLCDYEIISLNGDSVVADQVCLPTIKAWENIEERIPTKRTLKLTSPGHTDK